MGMKNNFSKAFAWHKMEQMRQLKINRLAHAADSLEAENPVSSSFHQCDRHTKSDAASAETNHTQQQLTPKAIIVKMY